MDHGAMPPVEVPALVQPWDILPAPLRDHWQRVLAEVPIPPALISDIQLGIISEILDAKELTAKVGRDPLLAGKVLAVANSAALGLSGRVTSLERAIIHLGTNLVQAVVLAYQMELVLKHWPGYPREHLNYVRAWGAGSSVLAHHFANTLRLPDAGTISTAALLARLGSMLIGLVRPAPGTEYRQTTTEVHRLELENRVWHITHPVLSERLALLWGLPEVIQAMLLHCADAFFMTLKKAPADRIQLVIATASALTSAYLAQPKVDGRILLDRAAYDTLKSNLKLHAIYDPCVATFTIPRVQRELAAATE